MARKVTVDLTDAVGSFMTKTNLMSDYMGDLDDLDSTFDSANTTLVQAMNKVGDNVDSINERLFGESAGPLHMQGINCDSASFKLVHAGQVIADSATIDSAYIKNLDVDFLSVDSASFDQASINDAIVQTLYMDDSNNVQLELDNLKLLTIKEESGNVVLAGYFLSTSNTMSIP